MTTQVFVIGNEIMNEEEHKRRLAMYAVQGDYIPTPSELKITYVGPEPNKAKALDKFLDDLRRLERQARSLYGKGYAKSLTYRSRRNEIRRKYLEQA